MNYGIPSNDIMFMNQNMIGNMFEEELFQIKRTIALMEERIRQLEEKEIKKDNPKFLNSKINNNGGLYMI